MLLLSWYPKTCSIIGKDIIMLVTLYDDLLKSLAIGSYISKLFEFSLAGEDAIFAKCKSVNVHGVQKHLKLSKGNDSYCYLITPIRA